MYWFMQAFKNYSNFSGRACRSEFNWFQGITSIAVFGSAIVFLYNLLASLGPRGAFAGASAPLLVSALLMTVFALGTIVPGWAVLVRRLHDIGLTGWWSLLVFVPYLGWLFLVVLSFVDSTRGANRYGPNPKGM